MTEFVHLRVHSEYSLSDGLVRPKALAARCAELGMPAVALTDVCNFYGLVKFHKAAVGAGVKPIFGADLHIVDGPDDGDSHLLTLLVMNDVGYGNLTRLISRAYREGQGVEGARVLRSWLDGAVDGLLALSGGLAGEVGKALHTGRSSQARELLQRWQKLFPGRFYLELQR
ncbi:MAG: PHP domain-containing protein, partial [Pseudomonadota bacterium]